MASFNVRLHLVVLVFSFHLLSSPVICTVPPSKKEKHLFQDINIYRKVLNLPVLEKRGKPSCLASEIAGDLKDRQCEEFPCYYPVPGSNPRIPNFKESVKKCKININSTKDGVIMPVCVDKLDPDALFSNYTKTSEFTKYLNNSKYAIAGVGSDDDWMVLIITTNTSSGDFSSATSILGGFFRGPFLLMAASLSVLFFF